jgi:hypothetical protein
MPSFDTNIIGQILMFYNYSFAFVVQRRIGELKLALP